MNRRLADDERFSDPDVKKSRPMRLALIDDDHSMHATLLKASRANGWVLDILSTPRCAHRIPHMSPHPDVVLMSAGMLAFDALQSIGQLKRLVPTVYIVVLANRPEATTTKLALLAGASAFLSKPITVETLVHAMTCVRRGWLVSCPASFKAVAACMAGLGETPSFCGLTPRELDIVSCLPQNLSNKEIGSYLGIATATVRVHRKAAFRKMGVHSCEEAIKKFIQSKQQG